MYCKMSLESIPKSLPADSHLPISEASRQMVNQFIKRSNGSQEANGGNLHLSSHTTPNTQTLPFLLFWLPATCYCAAACCAAAACYLLLRCCLLPATALLPATCYCAAACYLLLRCCLLRRSCVLWPPTASSRGVFWDSDWSGTGRYAKIHTKNHMLV